MNNEQKAKWTALCEYVEDLIEQTDVPGVALAVGTADCVPILACAQDGSAVAAIHAGWRGLSAGIVAETVRRLGERFGLDAIRGLVGAAGPSARGGCGQDSSRKLRR